MDTEAGNVVAGSASKDGSQDPLVATQFDSTFAFMLIAHP